MTETSFLTDREIRRLARAFQALRSVLRLRILSVLAQGEMNVGELEHILHVSQPLISWHLTQLRQAGFVRSERAGREIRYSIDPAAIQATIDSMQLLSTVDRS